MAPQWTRDWREPGSRDRMPSGEQTFGDQITAASAENVERRRFDPTFVRHLNRSFVDILQFRTGDRTLVVEQDQTSQFVMVCFTAATSCFNVNGFGKNANCSRSGRFFSKASSA